MRQDPASARYRLVHFHTDPFLGNCLAIGAIVATERDVRFIESPTLPCERCIGLENHKLLALVLPVLRDVRDFDMKSPAPNVYLGSEGAILTAWGDPHEWIQKMLRGGSPAR